MLFLSIASFILRFYKSLHNPIITFAFCLKTTRHVALLCYTSGIAWMSCMGCVAVLLAILAIYEISGNGRGMVFMNDWKIFGLYYKDSDASKVLDEYMEHIASKKLCAYKSVIHTGGKTGESLWSHVINLVTLVEKFRSLLDLTGDEMRCLCLALTVHDINKLPAYGKRADGKNASYSNAAAIEHLRSELKALDANLFWPDWEDYITDIKYLADSHQEGNPQQSQHDAQLLEQCLLDPDRLEGPLRYVMKLADVSDNSHSGDHLLFHETHIRDKFRDHLNAALNACGHPERFRFIGFRVTELRGLLTNCIHNEMVAYLQELYGKQRCLDVLYHPEGVDLLLPLMEPFEWTAKHRETLARRIQRKLGHMQASQLEQFVKARPHGISVDAAAMESGTALEDIVTLIVGTVKRKLYRQEWWEQRNTLVREDLTKALQQSDLSDELRTRIQLTLQRPYVLSQDPMILQRGELLQAYRNFLKEHYSKQLRAVKQDAWVRALRLFDVPTENDQLYDVIDPYRRAYFLAQDVPAFSLEEMEAKILADMASLEEEYQLSQQARHSKKAQRMYEVPAASSSSSATTKDDPDPATATLRTYLERYLIVWDSDPAMERAEPAPVVSNPFRDNLRIYSDAKKPDAQCCYCGSELRADEWMAMQVPTNIGVQSFSNRLEGGSSREPKRNVCDICRMQFLLEKLAWQSHKDKHGKEYMTFYLHLFPYSYFTAPLLRSWWTSVQKLKEADAGNLLINSREFLLQWYDHRDYFTQWQQVYGKFQEQVMVRPAYTEGLAVPIYSELLSNTPVLPLTIKEGHYGSQFLAALIKTVVLVRWFGCRILFSRLPTPLLNLATQYEDGEPIVLLVETIPQALSWLLPHNALTQDGVRRLTERLAALHALARALASDDQQFDAVVYDLVSAASTDSLALYHKVDRLIEQKAAQRKGQGADQAIQLAALVAPIIENLHLEEDVYVRA